MFDWEDEAIITRLFDVHPSRAATRMPAHEHIMRYENDRSIRRCFNPACGAILDVSRAKDDEEVECDFCGWRESRNNWY